MNSPQTVANARKKIAQLADASDRGDLVYRQGVASGWLSALRLEGLVDRTAFDTLFTELNAAYQEVGDTLSE
ncbi:hypothetical protein [Pseudomonas sp. BF-R-21]|uniref:hypothetical protein n=1 Tax=Pseudomonas sp. BF-R-21 TaxID=2832387 RepID=UPI001CBF679E|nr:hypothetical protein [Pseudomonas sp. BF-R-21]